MKQARKIKHEYRGYNMPHFIIECSQEVIEQRDVLNTIHQVHEVAEDSGFFAPEAIKVRMRGYEEYTCGPQDENFIHVFASIMDGRTTSMKKTLSQAVVDRLVDLYPNVPNIAMNVWEFEKATYTKRG
jgi:5-carboxymethyl-2-hydroxymuconate isomerase